MDILKFRRDQYDANNNTSITTWSNISHKRILNKTLAWLYRNIQPATRH